MPWRPIKLTSQVRTYRVGERLSAEHLGKPDLPEGVVAETWEIGNYRDARTTIASGPFADRLLHDLVERHPDEFVGEGWRGPHSPSSPSFSTPPISMPMTRRSAAPTPRQMSSGAPAKRFYRTDRLYGLTRLVR